MSRTTSLASLPDDDSIPLDLCEDIDLHHEIPPDDADTQDTVEDAILAKIAIDQALAQLPLLLGTMIELLYAYRPSPGYASVWPPTTEDVCQYLGQHFCNGAPVSSRTLWRWHGTVLRYWRKRYGTDAIPEAFGTLCLRPPGRPRLHKAA